MPHTDYQALVPQLVRDTGGTIAPADIDGAIELARLRYSQDAERTLVRDVVWPADGYHGPLPADWSADGSYILQAEYPVGARPVAQMELAVYTDAAGAQSLMVPDALSAGATVRVTFAAPHALTAGPPAADTVPAMHREAVANYAAHVLLKQLAAHYSGERETSFNADRSDTDSRARNYAARARECRAAYYAGIGKADPLAHRGGNGAGSGGEPAASVSSWAGRTRANLRSNDVGGW